MDRTGIVTESQPGWCTNLVQAGSVAPGAASAGGLGMTLTRPGMRVAAAACSAVAGVIATR